MLNRYYFQDSRMLYPKTHKVLSLDEGKFTKVLIIETPKKSTHNFGKETSTTAKPPNAKAWPRKETVLPLAT